MKSIQGRSTSSALLVFLGRACEVQCNQDCRVNVSFSQCCWHSESEPEECLILPVPVIISFTYEHRAWGLTLVLPVSTRRIFTGGFGGWGLHGWSPCNQTWISDKDVCMLCIPHQPQQRSWAFLCIFQTNIASKNYLAQCCRELSLISNPQHSKRSLTYKIGQHSHTWGFCPWRLCFSFVP